MPLLKLPLGIYDKPDYPFVSKTGCLFYASKSYSDDRGFFFESYKMSEFSNMYKKFKIGSELIFFPQDNISFSKKNVVRGMHRQKLNGQGKLVRALSGRIMDVVIDMNKESKTYGQFEVFKLSNMQEALYVPPTHAHGFWALEDTVFSYKCTAEYMPSDEVGINPLDDDFNFPWLAFKDDLIISPKDRALPYCNLSN